MANLPIIDVAPLLDTDEFNTRTVLDQVDAIHAACTGPGFFYLTGHGVTVAQERALFGPARRFFELPIESKLRIENVHSPQFRGYTRVGQERTLGKPDWREQLDIGAERATMEPAAGGPLFLRLCGPNQWPREIPELEPALLAWSSAIDRVAIALTRALAVSLGQSPLYFDAAFLPDPDTHVKVIRYPGISQNGSSERVGSHKDYGFLALVLQDDYGGLEVDDAHGGMIDVTPIPGTLVANLGEMFEVASGGYFRATIHRVRSPRASDDRMSIAHFFSPKLEAVLGTVPLPPHLADERPARAIDPQNPIYAEFGRNALRGWVRSHPEVARRHYPELA